METTNPLYSCIYLKLAKILCLSYYLLCFLLSKIREQEGGTDSSPEAGRREAGGRGQAMYTHVSKCKND
jgi:hypothetical protein